MDIDEKRLDLIASFARALVKQKSLPAKIEATTDRAECLQDADYVIVMIQVGGLEAYKHDVEIPLKYGIDQCVGDTLGPGGVFRGLRSIPVMLDICLDMEDLCPNALLMNYSNPMAINCWAMVMESEIELVGLCHGVQHTAHFLADFAGVPREELDYWTAGINHMAWFLRLEHKGEDIYPRIWEKIGPAGKAEEDERYRFEMMKACGYFMTESSGHLSEYLPYFRKRKELMEQFNMPGFGGESLYYYHSNLESLEPHYEKIRKEIAGEIEIPFGEKSVEHGANIIYACETGNTYRFNANIENTGLITNLPDGACVEVPTYVDRLGMHPCFVGDLPPQCAALCASNIAVQEMTVMGSMEGDREMIYRAVLADPLTAACLAPHEVRPMVDELFEVQRQWLPQFS